MACVFRAAALSSQAYLAWLAANAAALANNRHAAVRRADLVIGAALPVTLPPGGTAPLLDADTTLAAAGVAALVLRRTANVINAAGIVIATHRAAD